MLNFLWKLTSHQAEQSLATSPLVYKSLVHPDQVFTPYFCGMQPTLGFLCQKKKKQIDYSQIYYIHILSQNSTHNNPIMTKWNKFVWNFQK